MDQPHGSNPQCRYKAKKAPATATCAKSADARIPRALISTRDIAEINLRRRRKLHNVPNITASHCRSTFVLSEMHSNSELHAWLAVMAHPPRHHLEQDAEFLVCIEGPTSSSSHRQWTCSGTPPRRRGNWTSDTRAHCW